MKNIATLLNKLSSSNITAQYHISFFNRFIRNIQFFIILKSNIVWINKS